MTNRLTYLVETGPINTTITDYASINTVAKAAGSSTQITIAIASLLCAGGSAAVLFGLLSKLIQCIRFLNIGYSNKLQENLKAWSTNLYSINLPASISKQITSREIPDIFTTYGVDPSFLSNFWDNILFLTIPLAAWIILILLALCIQKSRNNFLRCLVKTIKLLKKTLMNFLIITAYGYLGDIIFFSVLEMQSYSLNTDWSRVSFATSILFLLFAACLLSVYCWFLRRYHTLKPKSHTDSLLKLSQFIQKYKPLEALYENYVDTTIFKHGFLLVIILRDIIISLMIVTLPSYPVLQAAVLCALSILICLLILLNNPFKHRFEQVSQIFLELCVLLAFILVLVHANLDAKYDSAAEDREQMGSTIIIINMILNIGCILILVINIIMVLQDAYKSYIITRQNKVYAAPRPALTLENTSQNTSLCKASEISSGGDTPALDLSASHCIEQGITTAINKATASEQDRPEVLEDSSANDNNMHQEENLNQSQIPKKTSTDTLLFTEKKILYFDKEFEKL